MFVIFSGVSGAGKQTVIDALMAENPGSEFVKSATTREKRSESENIHYFMTDKEFQKRLKKGEFFESVDVHGYMYGILNKDLQRVVDNPDILFFKDVEVIGTANLVKYLKGKAKVVTIFLECPDEKLFERLIKRGETPKRAMERIARGTMERLYKDRYDYVVENVDIKKTVEKVRKILAEAQK